MEKQVRTGLIDRRKELGMSQRNVAEAVGIDRSFYSRIETGSRSINVEKAWKILKVLKAEGKLELFINE